MQYLQKSFTVSVAPQGDHPKKADWGDLFPKPIGEITKFGKISAVGNIDGERYYWIIDESGTVSMMPADVVE